MNSAVEISPSRVRPSPESPHLRRSKLSAEPGVAMESFTYDDDIVRKFLGVTVLWGIVAFLAGLVIALELVVPSIINYTTAAGARPFAFLTFLTNVPFLTFGQLRP